MSDELRTLANFVCSFSLDDVDGSVRNAARFCILDSVGSALGASQSEEIRSISDTYMRWSGIGLNGKTASVWGQGKRANIFTALMINGLSAHELELDDVHTASKSHVGAVVVPAAWGVAEAIAADGKAFTEAVIVGYEVMGRVGKAMDVSSNRRRGWHTTGVIGTFGAAAAAGKLLKLSES